jgi:hypothetical protein
MTCCGNRRNCGKKNKELDNSFAFWLGGHVLSDVRMDC